MAIPKINFTKEQTEDIRLMYISGAKTKDIMERHNIHSPSTLQRVLKEAGVEMRGGKHKPKGRKCSCGQMNPAEARLCNQCGERLLTADELVIEGLLASRVTVLKYMPDNVKERYEEQVMAAINLLKIKCGVM